MHLLTRLQILTTLTLFPTLATPTNQTNKNETKQQATLPFCRNISDSIVLMLGGRKKRKIKKKVYISITGSLFLGLSTLMGDDMRMYTIDHKTKKICTLTYHAQRTRSTLTILESLLFIEALLSPLFLKSLHQHTQQSGKMKSKHGSK